MRYRNLIGPQIRKLRCQGGWTQEDLAGALQRAGFDISRCGVAKIESRLRAVGDHQLYYFRKVFGVSFDELFPPINPSDAELWKVLDRTMNRRI